MTSTVTSDGDKQDKKVSGEGVEVVEEERIPHLKGPEQMPGEIGGPKGPEPTRYGDWAFKGRCSDF